MVFVNDDTRVKYIRFLRKKSDTAEGLQSFIPDSVIPTGWKIGITH